MFVRAYLRASTEDQDAGRARPVLTAFASPHGRRFCSLFVTTVATASLLETWP